MADVPLMSNPMTTQDDLIVGGASGAATRLAKGTDGQRLTVDPATHHLAWADPVEVADILDLPTAETNTALVLAPDGAGGVEFRAETGGGGGGGTGARYPISEIAAAHNSQSSVAASLPTTPTNGNTIIVLVNSESTTNVTGITCTNVTFTKLAESTASTSPHAEIWVGAVGASPGTSITVTWSGTAFCSFYAAEFSGLARTLDQSAVKTNASNQYLPTITPTDAAALVVAVGAQSGFGAGYAEGQMSPQLLRFPKATGTTSQAVMFGFPGTTAVIGVAANSHGGTFSAVVASIT